jgi:hypothetical protein
LQQPVLANRRFGREELEGEAFTLSFYNLADLHAFAFKAAFLRPKTALILQAPQSEIKSAEE